MVLPSKRIFGALFQAQLICSMQPPIGMAIFLILVTIAVAMILIFAIRMTYLEDKESRQRPTPLPIEERAVRWEDDLVDEERTERLRDKLRRKSFNLGRARKRSHEEDQVILSPKSLPRMVGWKAWKAWKA